MTSLTPLTTLPTASDFGSGDSMVLFGELFSRGYANGLVEAAERKGMNIIYSTVGRRDVDGELRALNAEELAQAPQNIINVPLEAGFDMTKDQQGNTPCDQLKGLKLNDWQTAKMNWKSIEEACETSRDDFRFRVKAWVVELEKKIEPGKNLVIAHTMAGGVPRAKIIMPAMNRVFKGFGDRYASSEEFWRSDLGKFCEKNFLEVTAQTFQVLLEETTPLREKMEAQGGRVSYTAYGYHGTEILVGDTYQWQSYSPYLQGFAKIELENISKQWWEKGVKTTVFNAPEILTNSSGVFLGIEVPLYPLVLALKKEGVGSTKVQQLLTELKGYFVDSYDDSQMEDFVISYFNSDVIQKWSDFKSWPQHNGPEQMEMIKTSSDKLFGWQKDPKNPVTTPLSEIVFEACGQIMIDEAGAPRAPVWWIGHEAVALQKRNLLEGK